MTTPGRVEHLLTAAATDALTPAEAAELEQLASTRPEVRAELDALLATRARLDAWAADGGAWVLPESSERLDRAVASLAHGSGRGARRRTVPLLVAAAVALVALGSLGTVGVQGWLADDPVVGPPGTLGAMERLEPRQGDSPLPARVDAAFVAHTWGTEAVLDVRGTEPGEVYAVYVVDAAGREVEAGAFLGSTVEVHCRMNAAVLRDDVVGLRVADAQGRTVAQASAPTV